MTKLQAIELLKQQEKLIYELQIDNTKYKTANEILVQLVEQKHPSLGTKLMRLLGEISPITIRKVDHESE